MGLISTQVSGDHMIDRSRTLLLPGEAEPPPEPPYMRRQKQQQQQQQESIAPLKCPRCDSTNTKFCYYNNYNKSQPRHLCKACKRHWTKGGILRNVPVGGERKNKRLKTSNATTSNTPTTTISATSFTTDSNIPGALQIQDTEFLFSSLSNFECSSSLINPSSYDQFLRGYDFAGTIDAVGESTTTSTIPSMIMTAPSPNTSREFDIPSYWNWNSTIDLNIDWYNPEINP